MAAPVDLQQILSMSAYTFCYCRYNSLATHKQQCDSHTCVTWSHSKVEIAQLPRHRMQVHMIGNIGILHVALSKLLSAFISKPDALWS